MIDLKRLKFPYRDLLPSLSAAERECLERRIKDEGGVHDPVLLTEDEECLDGANRIDIAGEDVPVLVIPRSGSWSIAQRKAFVIRCNRGRRNLSPEQDRNAEKDSEAIALELKKEGKTQAEIAKMFAVSRQRVGQWLDKAVLNASPLQ
jgi:hypothetical protein